MPAKETTQTTLETDGRDDLHQGLIDKGVSKETIEVRGWNANTTENKINWLRDKYNELYWFDNDDWKFLYALKQLNREGQLTVTYSGERHRYYLPQGHRDIVSLADPDLEKLQKAGLIRRPLLNGEPRKRILKRTFWELTPSAKDCFDVDWSAPNEGDMGEGLVHRLGVWLGYWWAVERYEEKTHELHAQTDVKRYHNVDRNVLDLSVEFFHDESGTADAQEAAIEVEADSRHMHDTERDVWKMGNVTPETIWIFPTREVLVDVLQEMSLRGFTGLNPDEVPETLAVQNHRDTYNHRLEATGRTAPTAWSSMTYHPMGEVYTYSAITADLKETRPELFHGEEP